MNVIRINYVAALAMLAAIGSPGIATAFPGPRAPLFELWRTAEVVVYADVISATDTGAGQRSILSIARLLKSGDKQPPQLITIFNAVGGCPYPHHFKANERALIFLRYDPKELSYELAHRSDGVILCEASELEQYARRFAELTPILEQTDSQRRTNLLVSWCLECAKAPATRGEGVYGLQYLQSQQGKSTEILDDKQKAALVRMLVVEDPPGRFADELAGLLSVYPNADLDRYLLASLSACHKPGWCDVARAAVEYLPTRLGVTLEPGTQARIEQYWQAEADIAYGDDDRDPDYVAEARRRLHISWGFICSEVWSQCRKSAAKP